MTRMNPDPKRGVLVVLLAASLLSVGCLGIDGPGSEGNDPSEQNGTLTAQEEVREDEGIEPNVPPYYARRVHVLSGEISLSSLEVLLASVNGPVNVTQAQGTSWTLVARLSGYGGSQAEARDQLDRWTFNWTIGTPGARELVATVGLEGGNATEENLGSRAEASLDLEIPQRLVPSLTASTVNGQVNIQGLEAETMTLAATNGRVHVAESQARELTVAVTNGALDVDVGGTQLVNLATTNGALTATVDPGITGTISAATTNGGLNLLLPEDQAHGYEAEATATNGLAGITLQDGETGDTTEPDHATFQTNGFENREIRTTVSAAATNGVVHVGPTDLPVPGAAGQGGQPADATGSTEGGPGSLVGLPVLLPTHP